MFVKTAFIFIITLWVHRGKVEPFWSSPHSSFLRKNVRILYAYIHAFIIAYLSYILVVKWIQ